MTFDLNKLSQDKLNLTPVLSQMFSNPKQQTLRIQGPAGTGKTTVIEMIVRHFLKFNEIQRLIDSETKKMSSSNVFLCATTNKALAVISDLVAKNLENEFGLLTCKTIYSLLTLKVFTDYNTGQTKVSRNLRQSCMAFPKNSLIIIDEASYTDGILWSHIKDQLLDKDLNVIFIADFYQATPVGSSTSPIFAPDIPVYELTERFRYPNGSAIHLNSMAFERAIDTGNVEQLLFDNTFEIVKRADLDELIKHHLVDNDFDTKILAYKNKVVVDYNNQICKAKYGDTFFHVGQQVTSNKFYTFGQCVIRNEQKLTVRKLGDEYVTDSGLKLRNVLFQETGNAQFSVPSDFHQFYAILKKYKDAKNWNEYYNLSETILDIRHSWASTVHKAQGSTYDYAIVDFTDMLGITNPQLFYRLLNVATTRPRYKVFICKD